MRVKIIYYVKIAVIKNVRYRAPQKTGKIVFAYSSTFQKYHTTHQTHEALHGYFIKCPVHNSENDGTNNTEDYQAAKKSLGGERRTELIGAISI